MVEKNGTLSKKSRPGEAFSYVLNQWDALCYYSDDGLAEADNNTAERALRAVCLGKKNYMFFGSDHGGERGALLYGLIGTCRLNGIDPEAYLRHILSVLPELILPEFRSEALKLAERIGVTAAARELSLYESQLYNWRSKQQNQQTSSERELEMSTEIARLKRQLAERDEELAILQKAATYFAKRLK
ncbi:transposase [Escherichia coli O121:H19 str. K5269]|nr:transposase [Escherichia coli O121:H19 str. K5269]